MIICLFFGKTRAFTLETLKKKKRSCGAPRIKEKRRPWKRVCVCERERGGEREGERESLTLLKLYLFLSSAVFTDGECEGQVFLFQGSGVKGFWGIKNLWSIPRKCSFSCFASYSS